MLQLGQMGFYDFDKNFMLLKVYENDVEAITAALSKLAEKNKKATSKAPEEAGSLRESRDIANGLFYLAQRAEEKEENPLSPRNAKEEEDEEAPQVTSFLPQIKKPNKKSMVSPIKEVYNTSMEEAKQPVAKKPKKKAAIKQAESG
jgi:hypothetical protein